MNKHMILVVEDDLAIRNLVSTTLEIHGYDFFTAQNGEQAIMLASSHNPDAILLDLGLPDIDGVEIIKKIRTWSKTPIIVISARSDDSDKVEALDFGADDYITKPFSVDELLARLRVALRRGSNEIPESSTFINGDLKIEYSSGCIYLSGEEVHLTPMEYKLICILSNHVDKVLTHTFITKAIWGSSYDADIASLRVFMATLRKKIEQDTANPKYIQTHVGVGYRMMRV